MGLPVGPVRGLARCGDQPLAELPGRLGDELLCPEAEAADLGRVDARRDADLVAALAPTLAEPEAELEPAFSILVGAAGVGELETAGGERMPVSRGDTLLVPYAAGTCRVTGEVEALRCLPPEVVT